MLSELNLDFIYKATQKYYGKEGQESIDPVVFFKDIVGGIFKQYQFRSTVDSFCSDSLSIRLF